MTTKKELKDSISEEILEEFNELASNHFENHNSLSVIFGTFNGSKSDNRGFGFLQRSANNYRKTRHFTRRQASEIKKRIIAGHPVPRIAEHVGAYNSTIRHIMWGDYYWEIEPLTPHQVAVLTARNNRGWATENDKLFMEKYSYYPYSLIQSLIHKI